MGKQAERRVPSAMPSKATAEGSIEGGAKGLVVCGCRGLKRADNREPSYDIHGEVRFVTGGYDSFAGKHAVIFVHGYNENALECLESARRFFGKLHRSFLHDSVDVEAFRYGLFTWPGDTGVLYFDSAQRYAQQSGTALYSLLCGMHGEHGAPASISLVTHSLGAHVALRALSILGERLCRGRIPFFRVDRVMLLGAAVEHDAFTRPRGPEEYHFPEAAFGMRRLHMVVSRADGVLSAAFRINERDRALGHSGPESMAPLVSLARRVDAVFADRPKESFVFELHDFSPTSAAIMNPELHVHAHGSYWRTLKQTNYYSNLLRP